MKSYAALVHSLLRNERVLWTNIFTSQNASSMISYIAICNAIINEMQNTLFPSGNVHIHAHHGKIGIKPKVQNDFASSQISKQVILSSPIKFYSFAAFMLQWILFFIRIYPCSD